MCAVAYFGSQQMTPIFAQRRFAGSSITDPRATVLPILTATNCRAELSHRAPVTDVRLQRFPVISDKVKRLPAAPLPSVFQIELRRGHALWLNRVAPAEITDHRRR